MRIERLITGLLMIATVLALLAGFLEAQSSPQSTVPAANLNQLMRGLFFPHANVFFSAQRLDPAEIKQAAQASAATDPLTGTFGGWEAVENSALATIEAADLLMTPGRKCSNGRDVPVGKADWAQFVNELREAGAVAYKAAQSKDRENIFKAADVLNTACADCHNKYRPRVAANRCQ